MTVDEINERFLALLEAHQKILYKVAYVYCPHPDDRPDLIQEMIVQLWRAFPRFDPRYRFSTWMYRIAMNVAISAARRETRRARPLVPFDVEIHDTIASASDPAELMELRQAIDGLDGLNKALVLLSLEGHPHETIAEILGISVSNVGTRLSRVRQRLRHVLEPTDPTG
jgi:RNA polymerase sigma factor (sigma-70 family)